MRSGRLNRPLPAKEAARSITGVSVAAKTFTPDCVTRRACVCPASTVWRKAAQRGAGPSGRGRLDAMALGEAGRAAGTSDTWASMILASSPTRMAASTGRGSIPASAVKPDTTTTVSGHGGNRSSSPCSSASITPNEVCKRRAVSAALRPAIWRIRRNNRPASWCGGAVCCRGRVAGNWRNGTIAGSPAGSEPGSLTGSTAGLTPLTTGVVRITPRTHAFTSCPYRLMKPKRCPHVKGDRSATNAQTGHDDAKHAGTMRRQFKFIVRTSASFVLWKRLARYNTQARRFPVVAYRCVTKALAALWNSNSDGRQSYFSGPPSCLRSPRYGQRVRHIQRTRFHSGCQFRPADPWLWQARPSTGRRHPDRRVPPSSSG